MVDLARLEVAGDDHRECPGLVVESQVGLALGLVGAVAVEAGVGEDRPDIAALTK